jgi:hypothetical protein
MAVTGILPRLDTRVPVEVRFLIGDTALKLHLFVPLLVLAGLAAGASITDGAVRARISPKFQVEVNGYSYDWDNIGRFVMPGETLHLDVPDNVPNSGWVAAAGELVEVADKTDWVAPQEPGLYPVIVASGPVVKRVNAFVMVPYDSLDKKGYLKGYKIGRYPKPIEEFPNFTVPRGFIMVTPELMATPISQRYTLGEFVQRNGEVFPKYTALREEMLVKLECLTDLVQAKGFKFDKFTVLSGFRPPATNARVRYGRNSAHIYGGATDLYVDGNKDGCMDDLNHDGQSNRKDSKLLAVWVDELEALHPELVGGVGWYSRNRSRGPFVHVDVRGRPSRWHQ